MRDLLAQEAHDIRAAEAVALFCYQAKKWIGASLPRSVDWTRWCSPEASAKTRHASARASAMGWDSSASKLNEKRNAASEGVISTDASRVTVRVIRTDEDLMIARSVSRILETDTVNKGLNS